jgi:endonuclease YncB( thermonuclease family)
MLLTINQPVSADGLAGQVSIIDGDTLEIHGTRIRLWGIDAPESTSCRGDDSLQYRCGAKAANDLDAFIGRRPVSCIPISLDQYGRTVATFKAQVRRRPSVMRSMQGAVCGRAAMLSRGCIVLAFGKAAGPPTVGRC